MGYSALVIEDDNPLADVLRMKLEREGHEVSIAAHQRAAYHLLSEQKFDFALLDLRLPTHEGDMNPNSEVGFDILAYIRERFSPDKLPVIVMTAYEESSQTAVRALKAMANDYITKPFVDSAVSLDEKLAIIVRSIEGAGCGPVAEKRHRIVFTKDVVTINGIEIERPAFANMLRLLGRRTMMLSPETAAGDDPRMTGKEIAAELGVQESTVRQNVTRFRKWIARAYQNSNLGELEGSEIIQKGYRINFEFCSISRD